jgi:hypothetical protein
MARSAGSEICGSRGDLDRGPDHLVVLGGTRQFDGVAGKVTHHATSNRRIDRLHFDLVR